MLDGRDFALDGGPTGDRTSHFTRELPENWCFNGRAFGGYTSALALAAVFAHSGRPAAASLSVTFVEAGAPGALELDARTIRGGRTAAAIEVTISQNGRTILIASSWLADGWLGPPAVDAPMPFGRWGTPTAPLPDPATGTSLEWIGDEYPSLRFAHRRGVDYPQGLTEFGDRQPAVALWVTVDGGDSTLDPLDHPQIADVLHADAHLFDAPGKVSGFVDAWLLSLDLNLVWQPGAHLLPSTEWRLLEAGGSVGSGGVTAYGTLRGRDGSLVAVLTSQGLVR
ncbi:thioesterase family protein [Mycobacterium deserti]|uniref:Thioesterase family protein n=1 Tax=Mycobacterium deserti TaxID=2978347 RepID=A0ABT2MK15_9MYCO|nr:thioesterase family protein [Mycobacterium deserti]MCT7661321.1 thioesterase family protein [Mycobacterium deserti]